MKQMAWKAARLGVGLLACAILVFVGCESEDSPDTDGIDSYFDDNPYGSDPRVENPQDVYIYPSAAQVTHVGQQIVFDGRGGAAPYAWSVGIPARGTITVRGNSQGVYTALQVEENTVVVSDQNGHSAAARIVLEEVSPLLVVATDPVLDNDGEQTTVKATGGTPPYTWVVTDGLLGQINNTTGSSVVYTRLNGGDNSIVCTDTAGDTAAVAISQP